MPRTAVSQIVCTSPDGILSIEFTLLQKGENSGIPHYRVLAGSDTVMNWSLLGVDLGNGELLGHSSEILSVDAKSVYEEYTQTPGKRRDIVNRANQVTIRLRETTVPNHQWSVVVRAYHDGAAFRYQFPAQENWPVLTVAGELTEFVFPGASRAYALPLNRFTSSYEKLYRHLPLGEIPAHWLLGLPLLVERPDGRWIAITEADVDEYAGLYVAPVVCQPGTLSARLSPLPSEPGVAVRASLPHASPWRVIMTSRDAGRLIESDLVLNLNKPCTLTDVSWITSGRTTFPWWNGFSLDGVSFEPGLNTATVKHYIDFCSENGIEYHSLDGLGNTAWYGGSIVPYKGADPTTSLPEIDLPEVLNYARARGVRLRMWMHWGAAEKYMEKAFPLFQAWGVHGVMLDFMDRDDQEMNRFLRQAVALAARHKLTVTLHGCPKPTGLERTYPNLLTHEGVLNLEYNKWDTVGCPPEHEVTVPFTRMLAGPLDFHQGSFRTVQPDSFTPRMQAPLVMGTACRTLAGYVVYQNHLSMVADAPSAYSGHPALPVLVQIPTTWDDTRVVDGAVGAYLAIARRKAETWHLGVMTDRSARTLSLPLSFLGRGRYTAKLWVDDKKAVYGLLQRDTVVTAMDSIVVDLAPSGGAYMLLTPSSSR
ncbi:MAG TPA: glycoside hydrolase family 97 protein [Bacteroidota bacterium]|nr:glycoside hydrolase family 97 protein [Bacteroidota bacterium]